MKNFIEVTDSNEKKHLINIQHIEEIAEKDDNSCYIYLDVVNNGETQDYYLITEPYEAIKKLIEVKEDERGWITLTRDFSSKTSNCDTAIIVQDQMK